jgi:hypothetical protein
MNEGELEAVFCKVHHVSLTPGSVSGEVTGILGLVFHDPYLEDAVLFWKALLAYNAFSKAIVIDPLSIETLNLTFIVVKDDPVILTAHKVVCNSRMMDAFLRNHPAAKGLKLELRLKTGSVDEVENIDPEADINQGIWVEKWRGKK